MSDPAAAVTPVASLAVKISDRVLALRAKLIAQAEDAIGMDDYTKQISAYQHIMNDHLKLTVELAELVEAALAPPAVREEIV